MLLLSAQKFSKLIWPGKVKNVNVKYAFLYWPTFREIFFFFAGLLGFVPYVMTYIFVSVEMD